MNLIAGIGCYPWLIYCIYHKKFYYIPLSIFINGNLYHIFFNKNKIVKYYDIFCNFCFILYINNINKYNNLSTITTLISLLNFYNNNNKSKSICINNNIKHVLFTNWILMFPYHYSCIHSKKNNKNIKNKY